MSPTHLRTSATVEALEAALRHVKAKRLQAPGFSIADVPIPHTLARDIQGWAW